LAGFGYDSKNVSQFPIVYIRTILCTLYIELWCTASYIMGKLGNKKTRRPVKIPCNIVLYYTGLRLIFRWTRNNFQKYSTTRNALSTALPDTPRPIIFCYDTHIVLRSSSWKYFKCVPPRQLGVYIYYIQRQTTHLLYFP